jgi:hypothetical protein
MLSYADKQITGLSLPASILIKMIRYIHLMTGSDYLSWKVEE